MVNDTNNVFGGYERAWDFNNDKYDVYHIEGLANQLDQSLDSSARENFVNAIKEKYGENITYVTDEMLESVFDTNASGTISEEEFLLETISQDENPDLKIGELLTEIILQLMIQQVFSKILRPNLLGSNMLGANILGSNSQPIFGSGISGLGNTSNNQAIKQANFQSTNALLTMLSEISGI